MACRSVPLFPAMDGDFKRELLELTPQIAVLRNYVGATYTCFWTFSSLVSLSSGADGYAISVGTVSDAR